ncbi:MAG: glycosyltransferase family 39 protein [Anaerolineales bacterium]|nr:glycosyltransferase family 39 protein [Anaerolineales bacterium]
MLVLAILGIALIWYCTRWGAGLMDDSFMYINSAQNLVSGNGLRWLGGDGELNPLTHFPPLFSLTLAAGDWFGLEAKSAARVVNTLVFGINLLITGVFVERLTHSQWLAVLGSLLFFTSDVLIEAHAWAMSEPLFLCLYLGSVILVVRYLEQPSIKWIMYAGVLLGLSFLTRYIGIAFIFAAILILIVSRSIPGSRRWKDLLAFMITSLLPVIAWVAYTVFAIGSITDRKFAFYSITLKQVLRTFNTILAWFIPGRLVNGYEIVWIIAILVGGILLWLRTGVHHEKRFSLSKANTRFLIYLFLTFQFLCYIPIIFLSKAFFDPLTPLNNRILLPLLPVSIVLLLQFVFYLWNSGGQAVRIGVAACALILLGMYGYRAMILVPRLHENGLGFARKSMHTSPTMEALRVSPQTLLFSNSPAAITMWTGLPAYGIPNVDMMRQRIAAEGGLLVVFDAVSLDLYDTNLADLTQGFEVVDQYRDGTIYKLNPP